MYMNTHVYEMFSEIYGCFSFTLQALYTSFNLIEMFENLNEILPPTDGRIMYGAWISLLLNNSQGSSNFKYLPKLKTKEPIYAM